MTTKELHQQQRLDRSWEDGDADMLTSVKDLDRLLELTSIDQIEQAFQYLEAAEAQADAELGEILESRSEIQNQFADICHLGEKAQILQGAVSSICNNITTTAHRAELISEKVKHLDNEQKKIENALNDVKKTEKLIEDMVSIRKGIEENDIEKAAGLINYYTTQSPEIISNPFVQCVEWDIGDAKSIPEYMQRAKGDIKRVLVAGFNEAVQKGDTRAISLRFKLFPLIKETLLGLDKYSEFLCDMIKEKSKIPLQSGRQKESIFALRLTKLFETVAVIIDNNFPVVEKHYGSGSMIRVIQWLELEVDRRVQSIFDSFEDDREVKRMVNEIQKIQLNKSRYWAQAASPRLSAESDQQTFATSGSEPASAGLRAADTKLVSSILSELAIMLGQASVYQGFLSSRTKSNLEYIPEGEARSDIFLSSLQIESAGYASETGKVPSFDTSTGLLKESSLSHWSSWMTETYTVVERYTMQAAIEKAMSMDDVDSLPGWDDVIKSTFGPQSSTTKDNESFSVGNKLKGFLGNGALPIAHTSSCVDDFFFVLQYTLERTVSLHLPKVLNDMIHTSLSHLQTYFLAHMENQITAGTAKPHQSTWRSNIKPNTGSQSSIRLVEQKQRLVALNNVESSIICLKKLSANIKAMVEDSWAHTTDIDEAAIRETKEALETLKSFSSKLGQVLNNGIVQLVNQHAKHRVRSILQESYRGVRYVLSEEEFEIVQDDSIFQRRFISKFNDLVDSYKQCLTKQNFSNYIDVILNILVNDWERAIFLSKFNLLGGIIFEKDLRSIQQFLEDLSSNMLREKFIRLTQVAEILNIEQVEDIPEIWRSRTTTDPTGWTLNENDIKKLLTNRIDISNDKVQELSL